METYTSFGDVIVVMHDVSGQSEVTDLHYLALREKDIPGSQVPVNTLQNTNTLNSSSLHQSQVFSSNAKFHSCRYRLHLFLYEFHFSRVHFKCCFILPYKAWSLCKHASWRDGGDHWIFRDNNYEAE